MTRGKHTSKSAERIWKNKPNVSSSERIKSRGGGTEREISPVRRTRLQEPQNDTLRVEAKPAEGRSMTGTAQVVVVEEEEEEEEVVEVVVEARNVGTQIAMGHTVRSGSRAMPMPANG
jgi:hypothetical protein